MKKINALFLFGTVMLAIFNTSRCEAQVNNPYAYQDLSHMVNLRLKDSLKKAWVVPAYFKDKETQKKFKEFWDSRTTYITDAIDNKNFIQEKEIYAYIESIAEQLRAGNPSLIGQKPVLLIDRSGSVNAYSIGGRVICVNLGLIAFAGSREELALIIAHELAHDMLNHAENSMKQQAEWLTSDEYKKSLDEVLDSKYERYSRLKKVLEKYTFSRTRHSRYREQEADSLAIVLLKNSKIPFDAGNFLRLDSADMQFMRPLKSNVKDYFTAYGLPFEETWTQKKSKGLSSKNYSFKKTTSLADSLKTHPDCQDRYNHTKALSNATGPGTPIPASILNKVNKMIIWNTFDNRNLTASLYRVLQEIDKGNADEWHPFMLYTIFSGLAYSDNELNRFNAINVTQKEYISQSYYELQTMLEQMPRTALDDYHKKLTELNFWQKLPSDAQKFKGLFFAILDRDATDKARETAAKSFTTAHSSSMYCEFADHFIKK
ncbi:MAG TPA: M48 family metalloprotease [Flavisolibacter sp.]|nr:M48 family metalloprotease [Flavisolibacter sp.]